MVKMDLPRLVSLLSPVVQQPGTFSPPSQLKVEVFLGLDVEGKSNFHQPLTSTDT